MFCQLPSSMQSAVPNKLLSEMGPIFCSVCVHLHTVCERVSRWEHWVDRSLPSVSLLWMFVELPVSSVIENVKVRNSRQ